MKRLLLLIGATALVIFSIPKPYLKEGVSSSRAYYDRGGCLLRLTLSRDDKYRLWLPLKDLSPLAIEAALLAEDRYFYWHPGFNPVSLLRAFWKTYVAFPVHRMGGSTITMQLARIRYKINSQTIAGKLWQIIKALQLEWHYSKNEILEAYLNLAPYGGNIEGVGAASLIYFGKTADKLTLAEALTLAVIPKNPSEHSPVATLRHPEALRKLNRARDALFKQRLASHPKDTDKLHELRFSASSKLPSDLPFLAPHFVDTLEERLWRQTNIRTSLDVSFQQLLERQLQDYIQRNKTMGINNAAAVLVDSRSMEILAMVGSVNFHDDAIQGQVNGARAKRSPGSTLKPFLYALGMDQGRIHPLTVLKDAPQSYGGFNPENFDQEFAGPLTAKDALIRSRNIPAVQIAIELSSPTFYQFLQEAGISQMREESFYGLALALGGIEVTMKELVGLYAMLANGGLLKPLRYIPNDPLEEGRRLLSPEATALILDILNDVPRPNQRFHRQWAANPLSVFWKTGTSYAFRDAWSVGIFGPYVLAVWIGNFNGEGNPAFVGVSAAAPLFFQVVDAIRAQEPNLSLRDHSGWENLKSVNVCSVSGQIPGPHCSHAVPTWFIPGKSPIAICSIHREIYVDTKTGLRACFPGENGSQPKVYEFWPSDLLKIFALAGIPRQTPPPEKPGCGLQVKSQRGWPPRIISPQTNLIYNLRANNMDQHPVPLVAITDADARFVHWFINEKYLGKSQTNEPFFWKAAPGGAIVRAVDDKGRSHAQKIQVAVVE